MKSLVATFGVIVLCMATRVQAAETQECRVHVLVPITDDIGNHWKPGTVLPVDIERDNADGGAYCAHGGSCLPRKVNGSAATVLMNCKVGPALGGGDFRLVPGPFSAGPEARMGGPILREKPDTIKRLSALGFSNATAVVLANDYVDRPQSRNGQLVARALGGSQAALATLKRENP